MIYESVRISLNALELAAKNRRETRVWREARAAQAHDKEHMLRQLLAKAQLQERATYYIVMAKAAAEKMRYFRGMQEARVESYRLYWAKMEARLKAYREYQRMVQDGVARYRAWKRMVERDLLAYRAEQSLQEKKIQAYRLTLKHEAEAFLKYTREMSDSNRKTRRQEIQYAGRKSYTEVWGQNEKNASSKATPRLRVKA